MSRACNVVVRRHTTQSHSISIEAGAKDELLDDPARLPLGRSRPPSVAGGGPLTALAAALAYATLAGIAIPCGALTARIERLRPDWLEEEFRHSVAAFGGGVLLAAVALVLVPEGTRYLSVAMSAATLLLGGIVFMAADIALARRGGSEAQLMAMLLDFVPEAVALGATLAHDPATGLLLALLIALQNYPEGFNAYRELVASGLGRRRALVGLALLVPLGPLSALLGFTVLQEQHAWLGGLMLFAAGGILYLTFEDIAPQARLEQHWGPPLGAVLGFAAAVVGQQLVG